MPIMETFVAEKKYQVASLGMCGKESTLEK